MEACVKNSHDLLRAVGLKSPDDMLRAIDEFGLAKRQKAANDGLLVSYLRVASVWNNGTFVERASGFDDVIAFVALCHGLEELTEMFQKSIDDRGRITDPQIYEEAARRVYDGYDWKMNIFNDDEASSAMAPRTVLESSVGDTVFFDMALQHLLDMRASGQVHRLRHCAQCGEWFFARVADQLCCSRVCKKKYRESSREWKEAHNFISKKSYHVREYKKAQQKLRQARTRDGRVAAQENLRKHTEWLAADEGKKQRRQKT